MAAAPLSLVEEMEDPKGGNEGNQRDELHRAISLAPEEKSAADEDGSKDRNADMCIPQIHAYQP